jgi:hypothetical protein
MRPAIVIGAAVTAAILTVIGDIIGGVIAVDNDSVTRGVAVRSFIVVIALAVTAVFWWLRMTPQDRPETLLAGLLGGWLLNPSSWVGASFAGRLFTSYGLGAFVIDFLLWGITSIALIALLSRTSAPETTRR